MNLNKLKTLSNSLLMVLLILCSIACQKVETPEPVKAQENEKLYVLKSFWRAAENNNLVEAAKFTTRTSEYDEFDKKTCKESKSISNSKFHPNSNGENLMTIIESYQGETADLNKKGVEAFTKEIFSEGYKLIEIVRQKEKGNKAVVTVVYEYMGVPLWDENANPGEMYNAMVENERKKREEAKKQGKLSGTSNKSDIDSNKKERMFSQLDFVMYKEADGWKIFDITPNCELDNE